MSRFSDIISRLGDGKWRRIVIIAGIAAIALLFLSTLNTGGKAQEQPQSYSQEDVSGIDGVTSPKVMVTLDCTSRRVYAEETKSSSTSGEVKSESSIALSGSGKEALETSVVTQQVRGVAVVCGGAENVMIREKVVNTAARVLDIGISQVYVTN